MRKISFLLILLVVNIGGLISQPCLPEGITFTNQSMIDDFQINYPDCDIIEGKVRIDGNDISNLDGLSSITGIEGDLEILDNSNLTSLSGLTNITYVGSDFWIDGNPLLTDFSGLSSLTSIGGGFWISFNNQLTNFQGLQEGLPAWEIVCDPITNDLYLASDVGVFKRNFSASVWENVNLPYSDYPLKLVYDLDINNKSRTLYAATFGKGLWEAPLGDCPDYVSTPLQIKANTSWTAPKQIVSDVIVDSGVVLTIKDIVFFDHQASLIVESGAKLIVDGGILTNSCDSTFWQGIEVRGQSTEYQSPDRQGWLVIKNHGIIENAVTGVLLGSSIPGTGGPVGPGGGIIHAYNAEFLNNITAVEFEAYNQTSQSSFDSCRFFTNTDWPHQPTPLAFLSIDSHYGLQIKGCEFNNKAADDFSVSQRGYGIRSINSSYSVDHVCIVGNPCNSYQKSSFNNLYYGIYAMGSISETSLTIKNSEFESYRGIYLSAIDNAEIVLNDFDIGIKLEGVDEPYGLYLDECSGYHVEANYFFGNYKINNFGLYVNNSGTEDNIIYNNTLEKIYTASVFQDINRNNKAGGLQLKCNDYMNNKTDVVTITADSIITSNYGIAHYQGYMSDPPTSDPTLPAGNTFSNSSIYHNWDIYNALNGIVYVHHNINTTQEKIKPIDNYGSVSTIQNTISEYSKELACPSTLNYGGEELKSSMYASGMLADSTQAALQSLEDGGDTDELDFDVVMSMPGEGLETRDMLLDESPNLSDTVMITAIEKEEVLPNALIRDVLVENPQAAKSAQVQAALDERSDPMSAAMRLEIDAGRDSLSELEISHAALTFFSQQENQYLKQLHHYYTTDTAINFGTDSLMQLYIDNGSLEKQYRLAMLYLKMNDTTSCDSVIDNLQYAFDLNTDQEAERQDFGTYLNLLHDYGTQPDSTATTQFDQLMQSGNGRPAIYARNMLLWLDHTIYNEPLLLPDTSLKMADVKRYDLLDDSGNEKESWLSLKPNPAANYFIASWRLPYDAKSATLIFTDINGLIIDKANVYSRENEKVITTENWHPGTYLISLFVDGQLLETKKLSVIK